MSFAKVLMPGCRWTLKFHQTEQQFFNDNAAWYRAALELELGLKE